MQRKIGRWPRVLAIIAAGFVTGARAEIAFGPLFSDQAVLQRDKPVPVWGTGTVGESVSVSFLGQTRTAATAEDGRWLVVFDPLPLTTVGSDLIAAGKDNTVAARDVVVGDVWLCSGQSNMEFAVSRGMNAEQEIAAAQYPLIRHLKIERQAADAPTTQAVTTGWEPATPAHVGHFTAVGYFAARDLHLRLGVPIGIVNSTWGGTPVEAWMSPLAAANEPTFAAVAERWRAQVERYPAAKADYDAKLAAWTTAEVAAKGQGEKAHAAWLRQNPKPGAPHGAPGDASTPGVLYNGMIHPLVPAAICGIFWYQGESNTPYPQEYHALFSAMITAWRAHFGQGDLPFFWVSLAAFGSNEPGDVSWARLREAQSQTLSLPNTGEALAIDLGDANDIHPRNKQEVGRRLALLAKRRVYGLTADDTGPVFASATREGAALRVRFSHADNGLIAHDKPPQSLEVAGADRVFRPAFGRIERDTLVVFAPLVREPVAVRYAWRNAPEANLYGGNGLPVAPFRSDDW